MYQVAAPLVGASPALVSLHLAGAELADHQLLHLLDRGALASCENINIKEQVGNNYLTMRCSKNYNIQL